MNCRFIILFISIIGLNSCNHNEHSTSEVNKEKKDKAIDMNSVTEFKKELKYRDTIAIDYLKNKDLLNILKLLPASTMSSWEWSELDRKNTVESIEKYNYFIDSTEMFNTIKYIKPNTIGVQVVDGFWTLSIYDFGEGDYFIVTNDIVGDGNDIQTFNFSNNKIISLKMINWFGGFEYKLLLNNSPNCIELLEENELTYNYDFSDKNMIEISSLNKKGSENCFKGNSIRYKLNKENKTFDIIDIYWKNKK